jgi:hypothetical protein
MTPTQLWAELSGNKEFFSRMGYKECHGNKMPETPPSLTNYLFNTLPQIRMPL